MLKSMIMSCLYLFVVIVVAYITIVSVMFFGQRHLVFHPATQLGTPQDYGLPETVKTITLETSDNIGITTWYMPPPKQGAPIILYFHGNTGHVGDRAAKLLAFTRHAGILAVSYRGYGSSEGEPSEEGVYEDARTALRYLQKEGYNADQIIIYGESLGTGIAVQLATEFSPRSLVLEAPYVSLVAIGQQRYPWIPIDYLQRYRFESIQKVKNITSPTLIIHGMLDDVIPVLHGKLLLETLPVRHKQGKFLSDASHSDFNPHTLTKLTMEFWNNLPTASKKLTPATAAPAAVQ